MHGEYSTDLVIWITIFVVSAIFAVRFGLKGDSRRAKQFAGLSGVALCWLLGNIMAIRGSHGASELFKRVGVVAAITLILWVMWTYRSRRRIHQ
jgi:hypothetical protein